MPYYSARPPRQLYSGPPDSLREYWTIFRLLRPLPLTARFSRYSIPLYAVSGQTYPRVTIEGGLITHNHFRCEETAERDLRGPLYARSPSAQETILLKLVEQGDAEVVAWRHFRKTYTDGAREYRSQEIFARTFIAPRFPDDGWKRISKYELRGY